MTFELANVGRLVFGPGRIAELPALVRRLGATALVVTGKGSIARSGKLDTILAKLQAEAIRCVPWPGLDHEPEPEDVDAGADRARRTGCEFILAIGGGSVIDLAKAIAAMAVNPGRTAEYLEGVGSSRIVQVQPLPFVAAPTTAGAGAEMTRNSVLSSRAGRYKRSFRDEKLLARLALVDPELTLGCPPAVTAHSGMDAITQLIESYVTKKSNPVSQRLALLGLELAFKSLPVCFETGQDLAARSDMALAASLSGFCLSTSGLGAAHGIAPALGCHFGIPHGLACAVLLPHVMAWNASRIPAPYAKLGEVITGRSSSDAESAAQAVIEAVRQLNRRLDIPADLAELGLPPDAADILAPASRTSSMKANPIDFSDAELHAFLAALCRPS